MLQYEIIVHDACSNFIAIPMRHVHGELDFEENFVVQEIKSSYRGVTIAIHCS